MRSTDHWDGGGVYASSQVPVVCSCGPALPQRASGYPKCHILGVLLDLRRPCVETKDMFSREIPGLDATWSDGNPGLR
jgi:hypothetical protein